MCVPEFESVPGRLKLSPLLSFIFHKAASTCLLQVTLIETHTVIPITCDRQRLTTSSSAPTQPQPAYFKTADPFYHSCTP